jgi:lysophospholipase L1-like esterase
VVVALLAAAAWLAPRAMREAGFWEWEIRRLERRTREERPEPGGIVFTGSSSIRLWDTLGRDMAPLPVANRGFGGSHLEHVTHYAPRIVLPLEPRIVVVYAGDNDLAGGDKTPESVAADFVALAARVHRALPRTRIVFLSIKPSRLRWERWPAMAEANRRIEEICEADPRLEYVDVATPMLDADGEPRPELFRMDGLHLNERGYALWTDLVRPRLQRTWSRLGPPA